MSGTTLLQAKDDFRAARQKAVLQQIMANINGRSMDLLDYEAIRKQLRAGSQSDRGLQEIPVDAIVGSVGRSQDFTRSFLPKKDSAMERWSRVKAHVDAAGMDPVSVYKLGNVYFVLDGNHRVSIARQNNIETIPAYVTEVQTRVPLTPEDDPDAVICKARYADFLAETGLDLVRPGADLKMSQCGYYTLLIEHIAVHRHFMGLDQQRAIPWDEAVADWYDHVYLPIVDLAHGYGMTRDFPGYTDADLYVLVALNRAEIEQDLGWQIDSVDAVSTLPARKGRRRENPWQRVYQAVVPDSLEPGPGSGLWRAERLSKRQRNTLFADILVAGRGSPADANMLDHAIRIARREGSRILGLRVISNQQPEDARAAREVQRTFEKRCADAGVAFASLVEEGVVSRRIAERSVYADLVALSLVHRSGLPTQTGVGSEFNTILQHSRRPVLAVPDDADSPLDRALLAYDGSPKADEALFLAAYIAGAWQTRLSVLVVGGGKRAYLAIKRAEAYLEEQDVETAILNRSGNEAEQILATLAQTDANLLLIGSFGQRPLLQLLTGSTLNAVLRQLQQPALICR